MAKCNQCNKETENYLDYVNISIFGSGPISMPLGISENRLCPRCRVKAEIEVRDFINKSEYYKELKPF